MNTKDRIIELFDNLSEYPHTSGNTKDIVDFLERYLRVYGIESKNDNGNLIFTIPATENFKDKAPVILQGHIDMVGELAEGSRKNLLDEPIELVVSEDKKWLSAKDSTLGADDLISAIYMLLLLEDKDEHPEIKCIITRDEEIGLLGAKALSINDLLDVPNFINLDTEREGALTVGSSGGEEIKGTYSYQRKKTLGSTYEITVKGVTGGHSGGNITNNGAHAAKLIAQILGHLINSAKVQLVSLDCSGKNNVITDKARAVIITSEDRDTIINRTIQIVQVLVTCYYPTDPNIKVNITPIKATDKVDAFTRQASGNIIFNLLYIPYGVAISDNGKPLASSNIGSAKTINSSFEIIEHIRFAKTNYQEYIKNQIIQFFTFTNAFIEVGKLDPPWIKKEGSKLEKVAKEVWTEEFSSPMETYDVHATLEPGVFASKMPNTEFISFGPTVLDIHTPNERMDLDSAVRVYDYLKKLLKKLEN